MINRRHFGIASLVSLVMVTTACPSWLSSVYTDIKNYAPTILAAVASILSILTGAGIITTPLISGIVSLISTSVADLVAAVNTYQSAPADQKQTLLGKISTALADAEANIQQFWSDLTIPDPQLAATIKSLLGVIISTLAGYFNAIGKPVALSEAQVRRAQLAKTIQVTPKKRNLSEFKKDWNAALPANLKQHSL